MLSGAPLPESRDASEGDPYLVLEALRLQARQLATRARWPHVELLADEHQLAAARLRPGPGAVPEDVEAVVDAVENGPPILALQRHEPLGTINFLLVAEPLHEFLETLDVERLLERERMAGDVVMMPPFLHLVEEIRVGCHLAVHVEGVDVQQFIQRHLALTRAQDARVRVQRADFLADPAELRLVHEVGLVEQHEVGHRDLVGGDFRFRHLLEDLLGVDHGDDRVELHEALQRRDVDERLRHRAGIGDAGRLDEDVVEPAALEQALDALHEVFAHGAAHAAVAHLDDLVLLVLDQLAVDAACSTSGYRYCCTRPAGSR